jgi:hypothetical protein
VKNVEGDEDEAIGLEDCFAVTIGNSENRHLFRVK